MTDHNEVKKVPAVIGKSIDAATQQLEAQGFKVEVKDSIYIDSVAKSSVVRQSPEPDQTVKAHRTIYLTINRSVAPLVDMPDLRGFSFLSAKLYLQSLGLKLGDTSYRPDIARNSVLEQSYNGKPLDPGTKVSMGSEIDFVLGDGIGNVFMNVPDLVGMTLGEAQSYLSSLNVNLGAIVPNSNVTDQENAFVYKQNPEASQLLATGETIKNKIRPGEVIDVYLSVQPPVRDTTAPLPPPPQ